MSEVASEGMTFDQAKEAIESAGAAEAAQDSATAEAMQNGQLPDAAPDQADPAPTPGETPDPGATEFASDDASADSFMGSDFNPDLLPDELKPGFKQLQSDYTRKTQELAEQRKALEELGDPESLQQAAELYQSLQDPEYLRAFYRELGGVVKELGLPMEDSAAPVEEPAPAVEESQLSPELAKVVEADPELAPFIDRFTQVEQEMREFKEAQARERAEIEDQRQLMARAAEIDRMVQAVREDHPDYGEDDWQAIYDRAVAFDGDVMEAATRYEADRERIIQSWTDQKPVPAAVTPTKGAATVTEDEGEGPQSLDDAQKAAEAFLNANDLQEFTG